jgi:hypothetical protein
MSDATQLAEWERVALEVWAPDDQEGRGLDDALGRRVGDVGTVARRAVVAAIRRARGRIADPARWTPLHLAESRQADRADLAWWNRWPLPWSSQAVRWCAIGALLATCPDPGARALAQLALGQAVNRVELTEGHAATLAYMEVRAAMVDRIAARNVTAADVVAAVARLPDAERGDGWTLGTLTGSGPSSGPCAPSSPAASDNCTPPGSH